MCMHHNVHKYNHKNRQYRELMCYYNVRVLCTVQYKTLKMCTVQNGSRGLLCYHNVKINGE